MFRARGTEDRPDVPSLCDLARLQPLSTDRLDALARAATRAPNGTLSERASGALAALTGSISSNERLLPQPKEPLSDSLLAILRVSTGADVAALFGVLQTFVASSALPDRSLIRDYRDYARALPEIEKSGLASVLRDRVEARDPAFSDLAVRLAALIAFYLSEDYVRVAEGII